jgi:hypothetical protein
MLPTSTSSGMKSRKILENPEKRQNTHKTENNSRFQQYQTTRKEIFINEGGN